MPATPAAMPAVTPADARGHVPADARLDSQHAARVAGVSRRTVVRAVKAGDLRGQIDNHGRWWIDPESLAAWAGARGLPAGMPADKAGGGHEPAPAGTGGHARGHDRGHDGHVPAELATLRAEARHLAERLAEARAETKRERERADVAVAEARAEAACEREKAEAATAEAAGLRAELAGARAEGRALQAAVGEAQADRDRWHRQAQPWWRALLGRPLAVR